jgi:hypothetical protein
MIAPHPLARLDIANVDGARAANQFRDLVGHVCMARPSLMRSRMKSSAITLAARSRCLGSDTQYPGEQEADCNHRASMF